MNLYNTLKKYDLILILLLGALLRVITAIYSDGYNCPDEHFHIIEPAHGIVNGYWAKSWEWISGIRSFFLPYMYAFGMKALDQAGVTHPHSIMIGLRIVTAMFSLLGIWAVYQITSQLSGKAPARMAAIFMAIWWTTVYYGVRTMAEPISTVVILLAHYVAYRGIDTTSLNFKAENVRELFISGLLFGLAFAIRFHTGIVPVGIAAILLFQKQFRLMVFFSLGVLIVVSLQGILDIYSWGSFLHSPIYYFKITILDGVHTSVFGANPWHRYLTWFIRYFTAPLGLAVIVFSIAGWRRYWPLWITIIFFLLLHWPVGHKEDRFLLPLVPFYMMTLSISFFHWYQNHQKKWEKVVSTLVILSFIGGMTYKYKTHKWRFHHDITGLYETLYEDESVKGILVAGVTIGFTGGYFYLHKNIPLEIHEKIDQIPEAVISMIPTQINTLIIYNDKKNLLNIMKKNGIECHGGGILYRCN